MGTVKQEIQHKIDDLFSLRRIPILFKSSGLDSLIYSKLQKLQTDIYLLDQYIEDNWDIDEFQEEHLWGRCKDRLHHLGFPTNGHDRLLSELTVYLNREKSMRQGLSLNLIDIKSFYFYKSCDVHLIRAIIYKLAPHLDDRIPQADWKNFDFVTEIMDDLSDYKEDMDSLNGNRFLFSIFYQGIDYTLQEYLKFLDQIQKEYFRNPSKYVPLTDWFREEAAQVQALLKDRGYFDELISAHPKSRLYQRTSLN